MKIHWYADGTYLLSHYEFLQKFHVVESSMHSTLGLSCGPTYCPIRLQLHTNVWVIAEYDAWSSSAACA